METCAPWESKSRSSGARILPPAKSKGAVMASRGVVIRAALFLFLLFSFSSPYICLSAEPVVGSFPSGGGAVHRTGQLRESHTSIRRQVISRGGGARVSRSSSSAAGGGTSAGARGGGGQPHGPSLVPVVYGAAAGAAVGAAARSHHGHNSSSVSNHCRGSKLLLTAWAAFSCLLLSA